MSQRRFLVPTDFSSPSAAALRAATTLAARLGSTRVDLVHAYQVDVVAHADFVWIPPAAEVARAAERAEGSMRDAVEQQRALHPGLAISGEVHAGTATDVILAAIRSAPPDLVVQGTHGRGFWSRAVLGSVANEVVSASPVPVLSVRATDPPADLTSGPTRILVASDFTAASDRALGLAVDLAGKLGSAVRMVFCYRHPQAMDEVVGHAWAADIEADARRLLQERVDRHAGSGVTIDFVLHCGARTRGIVSEAEHASAGLIVMGAQRHQTIDRLLLGDTAREVVRLASCPVITWGGSPPG